MVEEIEVEESDLNKPRRILQSTWDSISPLTAEEDLIVVRCDFPVKKEQHVFIGKILRHFMIDKEGPVESLDIRCLMNKGSGTILDDTPAHCPDIYTFDLEDVIYGPCRGNKFNVPDYQLCSKAF